MGVLSYVGGIEGHSRKQRGSEAAARSSLDKLNLEQPCRSVFIDYLVIEGIMKNNYFSLMSTLDKVSFPKGMAKALFILEQGTLQSQFLLTPQQAPQPARSPQCL